MVLHCTSPAAQKSTFFFNARFSSGEGSDAPACSEVSALLSDVVLRRGIFPGLVQLHGCVLVVDFGNINWLRPTAFLVGLGQAGESDVVNVARYGVGDMPVLRVTTAVVVFLLGVDRSHSWAPSCCWDLTSESRVGGFRARWLRCHQAD